MLKQYSNLYKMEKELEMKEILYEENIYALIVRPNPQNKPENRPNDIPLLFFITVHILFQIF